MIIDTYKFILNIILCLFDKEDKHKKSTIRLMYKCWIRTNFKNYE